ncbi:MAG: acyltransferase family protein [Chitinophagaceae bacterium]|nr:acyltransferase family protein [Chitinophagaceae bacterium]
MKQRIAYIDQIKVFLTCLVVAHHAAQAYGPTGGVWVVTDTEKAPWLKYLFFINASYMMGLYFFISGYFLGFSALRKTPKQIFQDRLKRLGIPLLFFTLVIFLPFNYILSGATENLFSFFINTYFHKPPLATGHLWFVASLLMYTTLYLVIKNWVTKSPELHFRISHVFLYIIFLTLITAWVRQYYPIDKWTTWLIPVEVAHLPQYISMFLLGTIFNRQNWLNQLKRRDGLLFLSIAIIGFMLSINLPVSIRNYWITESLLESLLCVGMSIALLTFFRHYGNHMNSFIENLSVNSYGIYLFHLFVVIGLQNLLMPWQADANVKFITVTVMGILLSLGISVAIRKISWVRKII